MEEPEVAAGATAPSREPTGPEDSNLGPEVRDLSRSIAGRQPAYPVSAGTVDGSQASDPDSALPVREASPEEAPAEGGYSSSDPGPCTGD